MNEPDAALLSACYRLLLLRDPDPIATEAWTKTASGGFPLEALLNSILRSDEFKANRVGFVREYFGTGDKAFFADHSQFGEFGKLLRGMVGASIRHRIVVDVGANGRPRSNSFDLLNVFGWSGLLIEANSDRNPIITAEFAGLDFKLLNYAISDYEGEATFYIGVNDDVSSLEQGTAANWGPIRGRMTVQVRPLTPLLREHGVPLDFGLLSVDAEGQDVAIVNDAVATGCRPQWIIFEAGRDCRSRSVEGLGLTDQVLALYTAVDGTEANLIMGLAR